MYIETLQEHGDRVRKMLKDYIRDRGITLSDFAVESGFHHMSVITFARDEREAKFSTMCAIEEYIINNPKREDSE